MSDDLEIPDDYRVTNYNMHIGDLVEGTAHLTNAQFGAYTRIFMAMVNKPNGLTLRQVKAYSRITGRHWESFWSLVEGKFVEKDGIIYHSRVRVTVHKMFQKSLQNKANRLGNNETAPTGAKGNDHGGASNPLIHKSIESLSRYDVMLFIKDLEYDDLKREFKGWDIQEFIRKFNDAIKKKGERPAFPYKALRAYIIKATEGKTP